MSRTRHTPRCRRSWLLGALPIVFVSALALAGCMTINVGTIPSSGGGGSTERPFTATSAWNLAIPASPRIDSKSASIVSYLSSGSGNAVADLYEYGVPVWDADASTPRASVTCWKPWGTCALEYQSVPIPSSASPSSGSDGAMVVIDWSTGKVFEFYKAAKVSSTRWTAGWGDILSFSGSGTPGQAVGAGVSRLAGVVRVHEIKQGRIDHALVFSTSNACTSSYRYPASKTDGASTRSDCIPQGARIQLDPSIDVDKIPGITPGEKMVAKALQTYGAYPIDNGGAKMAFIFEKPSGESDPYCGVGICGDYDRLDHIPWSGLRVLRAWNG